MENRISYILLMVFWAGVIVLKVNGSIFPAAGLRALAGKGRDAVKRSRPYSEAGRLIAAVRREKLKSELSESLAYTRNIAILGSRDKLSAQALLSGLAGQAHLLRPVFLDMAHSLNLNDRERAAGALYTALPEPYSKDIGVFLASWEDIDPQGLVQTLEVYRSMLLEDRMTRIRKKDELISDLIYLPVVLNCMVVLLNFLYVAYFLEQKELLSLFF